MRTFFKTDVNNVVIQTLSFQGATEAAAATELLGKGFIESTAMAVQPQTGQIFQVATQTFVTPAGTPNAVIAAILAKSKATLTPADLLDFLVQKFGS